MKNLSILLAVLVFSICGLGYLMMTFSPSPLGKSISQGLIYRSARTVCLEEIRDHARLNVNMYREQVCTHLKKDASCIPTTPEVNKWLEMKIDRCARKKAGL